MTTKDFKKGTKGKLRTELSGMHGARNMASLAIKLNRADDFDKEIKNIEATIVKIKVLRA